MDGKQNYDSRVKKSEEREEDKRHRKKGNTTVQMLKTWNIKKNIAEYTMVEKQI